MDRVYICSRYRAKSPEELKRNIELAKWACRKAMDSGYKPFAPHLFYPQFLDDNNPDERQQGLKMALDDLRYCRELWIIEDGRERSEGMKREEHFAREICKHIRVIKTPDYAENYMKERSRRDG